MLIVQKFGGSSLADIERLRRAAGICMEARRMEHRLVVVVSAPGDSTDELMDLAQQITPRPSPRELDALMATGEQRSAALMAMMLQSLGAQAASFTGWQTGILTSPKHTSARIELIAPERISAALARNEIAVVAGFQGISPSGDITTLGRGGSDTTAVALAAALNADRCEIYTDVDGIYTADPRLVTGARRLEDVDFRDMLALADNGSQVLHPESVRLAMANGIEIRLLSSFEGGDGSRVRFLPDTDRPLFAGVTRSEADCTVTAVGKAADASTLSELVLLLGRAGVPVLAGAVGEGCVSVKVAQGQLLPSLELIHAEIMKKA